jgi:hypothetical protein
MARNFCVCSGFLLCLTVATARGDEASKAAKVEEFIRVSRVEDNLRQTLALSMNQLKSGFLEKMMGVKLSPEQDKMLGEFQDKISKLLTEALDWDKLKPDYVRLYSEAYSESELDDLVTFYKSSTGQALAAKTPMLMSKSSEIVQQRMAAFAPEIQKLMADFMAQAARQTQVPEKKN